MKMKPICIILMVCSLLCVTGSGIYACEPVYTRGNVVFGQTMENAAVTVNGETLSFKGNCLTKTVYSELNKFNFTTTGTYDYVQFYLQLSPATQSTSHYGYVRVIYHDYTPATGNKANYSDNPIELYQGQDAKLFKFPINLANSLVFLFNSKPYQTGVTDGKTVIVTLADMQFIKNTPMAPTAKVTGTDVTLFDNQLRSTATVEFSQEMNTENVDGSYFGLAGGNGSVTNVSFDGDGKIATIIFDKVLNFEEEYTLTLSPQLKNKCVKCEYNLSETSLSLPVKFVQPADIIIGNGVYKNAGGTELSAIENGTVQFQIPVSNKFDLTEGGRNFCLMTQLYVNGAFKSMQYDTANLMAGQKDTLKTSVEVTDAANSRIISFLWDNPYDMLAYTDSFELK